MLYYNVLYSSGTAGAGAVATEALETPEPLRMHTYYISGTT